MNLFFFTLLEAGVLASDAALSKDANGTWSVLGDPTEGALVVAAAKLGIEKASLDAERPRIGEVPFTSETRRMATLHRTPGGRTVFVKGAPEVLLAACSHSLADQGPVALDDAAREKVLAAAKQFASEALRVLAIAQKVDATLEDSNEGLSLLGLVGMIDPPRPEAFDAIAKCESAGIRAVMITGDHPETAQAVARELGILKEGKVVSGRELDGMDEAQLAAVRARAARGDVDDLRLAGADPVLQGVQLPLRPRVGAAPPLRQQVAQHRHRVGAGAAAGHSLRAVPGQPVRHVPPLGLRLAHRRRRGWFGKLD